MKDFSHELEQIYIYILVLLSPKLCLVFVNCFIWFYLVWSGFIWFYLVYNKLEKIDMILQSKQNSGYKLGYQVILSR